MTRWMTMLVPPILAVAGLFTFVNDPATARPEKPREPATPGLEADRPAPAVHPDAQRPDPAADAAPAPSPGEPFETARMLVTELESWVSSGIEGFPEETIRDLVALIEKRPEIGDSLLKMAEGRPRDVWRHLGSAFARLSDHDEQTRLVRAHRAADPWTERLERAWSGPESLLAALDEEGEPGFRIRSLDGIPGELLDDERVRSRVREMAENARDPQERSRAIARLARMATAETDALLVRIVEDGRRPIADRQAAAMNLTRRATPEVRELFLRVLERRDATPLLLHAIRGLGHHAGELGVVDGLLTELEDARNPEKIRRAAADSLGRCVAALTDLERASVVERVRRIALDLTQAGDSPELVAHVESRFRRHWEGTDDAGSPAAVLMTR